MSRWILLAVLALALWGILELVVRGVRRWLHVAFSVSVGNAARVRRSDPPEAIALVRCANCGQHVPQDSARRAPRSMSWVCSDECLQIARGGDSPA